MNMNMLMQQAKKMQKDMENAKNEVGKMIFTSVQPLVQVCVNGNREVTEIKINNDINKEDIEILEDMLLLALNDALNKASNAMEDKIGNVGAGLGGLF